MDAIPPSPSKETAQRDRAMVYRAELMGGHSHRTDEGVLVHVWRRNEKYLARGRYDGQPFGETLGANEQTATSRLRQLLTEIENGSFVRPSEARKAPLGRGRVPQLTLRELCNEFLGEKRKTLGKSSTKSYTNRLAPVLDFSELSASRKKWPLAASIDRAFMIELRQSPAPASDDDATDVQGRRRSHSPPGRFRTFWSACVRRRLGTPCRCGKLPPDGRIR